MDEQPDDVSGFLVFGLILILILLVVLIILFYQLAAQGMVSIQ